MKRTMDDVLNDLANWIEKSKAYQGMKNVFEPPSKDEQQAKDYKQEQDQKKMDEENMQNYILRKKRERNSP